VQLYTSASNCKDVGNVPVSHFVKAFPALPSHSYSNKQHHKSAVSSLLLSVKETGKNHLQAGMRDAPVLPHCSLLRNP
jgi:hypothetical protein